jgi:hypothetical protein
VAEYQDPFRTYVPQKRSKRVWAAIAGAIWVAYKLIRRGLDRFAATRR